MSPLGSLGGLQLTLTVPDTLLLMAVTDLGDELGAAALHRTAGIGIVEYYSIQWKPDITACTVVQAVISHWP